ncbi:protein angel homolog 2-like isoform X3 [Halichondria panicea]|uniref:protein angel homolog 2-like isoform X3 n=1 Tax=Halichondria panicea TaxID=6063 RepID=UPI00312B42D5
MSGGKFFLPPKKPKSSSPPKSKLAPHPPLDNEVTMVNGCYFEPQDRPIRSTRSSTYSRSDSASRTIRSTRSSTSSTSSRPDSASRTHSSYSPRPTISYRHSKSYPPYSRPPTHPPSSDYRDDAFQRRPPRHQEDRYPVRGNHRPPPDLFRGPPRPPREGWPPLPPPSLHRPPREGWPPPPPEHFQPPLFPDPHRRLWPGESPYPRNIPFDRIKPPPQPRSKPRESTHRSLSPPRQVSQPKNDSGPSNQKEPAPLSKKQRPDPRSEKRSLTLPPLRPKVIVNQELNACHSLTLSVLCYNILAQDLIKRNMCLYSQRLPHHLDWMFRRRNLVIELDQQNADIVCLQEVQEEAYKSFFLPHLITRGFAGLYKRRTGSHTDGCALFYKQDKLTLIEHRKLEYRKSFKVLNRDNVGIIAKFSTTGCTGVEGMFCVATTHLLFNPKAGEVKLAQLGYLLAELHRMATIPDRDCLLPVILCGDFNSLPNSHLVNFITSAKLDYSEISAAEVAGFGKRRRSSGRDIPKPLFPSTMGIDNNCCYREPPTRTERMVVDVIDLTLDDDDDGPSQGSGTPKILERPLAPPVPTPLQDTVSAYEKIDSTTVTMSCTNESPSNSNASSQPHTTTTLNQRVASSCDNIPQVPVHLLTHPFNLLNCVYPYSPKSTVTTFHQSAFEMVDYIFFTPLTNSKGFRLLHRKALPSTDVLKQFGPQPHEFLSSDHLFLCAMFQLIY